MIHSHAIPQFPLRRSAVALIGVVVSAAVMAGVICGAMGRVGQLGPMAATAAACVIASIIGLVLIARCATAGEGGVAVGFMTSTVVRMAVVMLGAVLIRGVTGWSSTSVGLWSIGWYVLTLVLEVAAIQRHLTARESARLAAAQEHSL